MLAVCFNLIGLSSRLTNLVPVACMNAVGTSFAYCFQIAGGIYVIFLELVAWIVASLFFFFNVTASENKLASLPYEYLPVSFCCLSAAFLSFGKLETHFTEEDWVFRENELQPSSQKQERREVFSAHRSPCCILVLGKVQAGNWALLLLLITELLVSQFSFPHALSLPSGLS